MNELLLRPTEAAKRLSISRAKCYQLISRGIIPSVRLDKSVRVPANLLEDFVARLASERQHELDGE